MSLPQHQRVPLLTWLATSGVAFALVLLLIGVPVAISSFNSANAVPYSCPNHLISELGFPFASRLTWVFNGDLTLLGVLVLPALIAVSEKLKTRLAHVAAAVGSIAFLALSVMGVFGLKHDLLRSPYRLLNFLSIHTALAGVFFLGWIAATALFALAFWRHGRRPIVRLVAATSFICCCIFPITIVISAFTHPTESALQKDVENPAFRASMQASSAASQLSPWLDTHRPRIWPQALLEWCMAWASMLWFAASIAFLWSNDRQQPKSATFG